MSQAFLLHLPGALILLNLVAVFLLDGLTLRHALDNTAETNKIVDWLKRGEKSKCRSIAIVKNSI
jgi:hypothetical protein